jgi:hypothetical protein
MFVTLTLLFLAAEPSCEVRQEPPCGIAKPHPLLKEVSAFIDLKTKKCGLKNWSTNAILVPARYDFCDGNTGAPDLPLIGVCNGKDDKERCGFIDLKGKVVVPLTYKRVMQFNGGVASVTNDEVRWGAIDPKGQVVVPLVYDEPLTFHDGLSLVEQGRHLKALTPKNETAFEFDLTSQWGLDWFAEGRIAFHDAERHWGYLDSKGVEVIAPRFMYAQRFSSGVAAVKEREGVWSLIDRNGERVVQFDYPVERIEAFIDGYARFSFGCTGQKGKRMSCKHGCIDTTGALVGTCIRENITFGQ